MYSISRLGYVSGTVGIDEKGGYFWFGTHITINFIGMNMGEATDSTIYYLLKSEVFMLGICQLAR